VDSESNNHHLLARVAVINANDTLSLHVRELWAERNASTIDVDYIMYSAASAYDEYQDRVSLTEANEALRSEGGSWLRSTRRERPHRLWSFKLRRLG
jgi:hypothetical protein